MAPTRTVLLQLDAPPTGLGGGKKLTDGLSAVLQVGDTLWVANDESLSVERLTLSAISATGYCLGADHKSFALANFLELPADEGEADLEGLAYADGYLWLVGSHSLKRKKPKPGDDAAEVAKKLAKLDGEGNRYLLARIPLEESGGLPELQKGSRPRHAARLHGDKMGNDLIDALREDEHLAAFLPIPPADGEDKKQWRGIPGKDNGLDIEGLAALGGRLFLGLRGPVLRGHALVLEVELEEDGSDNNLLRLKAGADGRLYRKHFLNLGGLGVRDLCVSGDDLLVLAGPAMDHDGPHKVFRWQNPAQPSNEAARAEALFEVPHGEGVDRAEGISLFCHGDTAGLIVAYDAPAERRQSGEGKNTALADVFAIP
ncbi:MAG: DUF3616 domain-containing protein [Candidatus Methylumidiphilus sp.]